MSVSGTTQGIRPGVCLSTNRPASPFTGQVIYMSDTDETAVWDGTAWEGFNRSRDRNVIINGAMQVAQRGTSVASLTTGGYRTADRWNSDIQSFGTWTQSIENDGPTGTGLRKSLKWLCTTAAASPSASTYIYSHTLLEGQNVQQFLKGSASAKQFTLSFWVKSNKTGTYICELDDKDNNRQVSASYTISASATWEKKTITFPADTTGVLDNDNAASLVLNFWLGAGSTFTGGSSLNTTWGTPAANTRVVGQTNLADATNNYWQITGVQLEAGSVATPFEFEDYGTTFDKCLRYFQVFNHISVCAARSATSIEGSVVWQKPMRIAPVITGVTAMRFYDSFGNLHTQSAAHAGYAVNGASTTGAFVAFNNFTGMTQGRVMVTDNGAIANCFTVSAEL